MITTISFAQVSTIRMNDFRLGDEISDVEKLIGKTINLNLENGYQSEPGYVIYKGVVYEVYFYPTYDDNGRVDDLTLYSIRSKDKTLKTTSGIKIGSTFDELLSKFKNYNIEINDSWDDNGIRTKTERLFKINDSDSGTYLLFTLKDEKVIEFYISYNEGC
jgi:hypothetical protein